jgi:hypothetical protein
MPFYIGGSIINFIAFVVFFSNPTYINERIDPNDLNSAVKRPLI